jgi:hypothetical protein
VKEKYRFLLSLKSLDFEIRECTRYSRECLDCFDLLKTRLDELAHFILRDENIREWKRWEQYPEVLVQSEQLRETSAEAVSEMEKYQSLRMGKRQQDISQYINRLANTVKDELRHYGIDDRSKVLFIGSGAFPTSVLTIAKETQAQVVGLDIDPEALDLAEKVVAATGWSGEVSFTDHDLQICPFVPEATHILIASLVKNKTEVLNTLRERMDPKAKVILRYGNGIKSIFNYPLEKALLSEWDHTEIRRDNAIYDTVVLQNKDLVSSYDTCGGGDGRGQRK